MKVFFLLILATIFCQTVFSQQIPLPVNNPNLLKVSVTQNGIHRLTKSDFDAAGVSTGSIDPRTVRMIHRGQEVPLYFSGESNGVFDPEDYMDFYGERKHGGLTNYYNGLFALSYQKFEFFDYYSDTNVYWITWGGHNGLRYNQTPIHSGTNYEDKFVYHELHFEQDQFYSLGENLSSSDFRIFLNDLLQGEGWYWRRFLFNNTLTVSYNMRNVYKDEYVPVKVTVNAYPENQNTTIFNEHKIAFTLNGNALDTFVSNNMNRMDTTIIISNSVLNNNSNNSILFRYRPPTTWTSGVMNFDYFKISYPRRFLLDSNKFSFATGKLDSSSRIFRIKGYNSANEVNIYDVKNSYKISGHTFAGDTLIFTGKGDGKFEIINSEITQKPLRIVQRILPDLTSSSNGADYLIVYNKAFETQTEQLRVHRQNHDGFRSVKMEIEDIYDVFNYGIENPVAVRKMMEYVYNNWQQPQVRYLCLFGRGSLDPKKNLATSIYNKNFVPVWGNPATDGYFVNFTQGTFTFAQRLSVGRLPAYTSSEAQIIVDKIIHHDTRPIDEWDKEYTMITGGFTRSEQNQFSAQSNTFVNTYITAAPLSADSKKIYRNDSTGYFTFNYTDSIVNTYNRGTAVVNYIGHAATDFWDNGIEDPGIVNNAGKTNLILSFTCFTGRNAEAHRRSFGEKFMLLAEQRGTVGFIGSTGWSFVVSGNAYNNFTFRALSKDSIRALGDIVRKAGDYMKNDSGSFSYRNMLNCYNLIGDPALKLKQPMHPEFVLKEGAYKLSNEYPSLHDEFLVTVYPLNLGSYSDSCKFRFTLFRNGVSYKQRDTVLYGFSFRKTLIRSFVLDSIGIYSMRVEADPDNWFPQDNPSNNFLEFDIPLRNISYTPLKPLDNEIIRTQNVEFVGLNPVLSKGNNIKVVLQIDTVNTFSSPLKQIFFQEGIDAASTRFKTVLPIADSNVVYFWRMSSIVNNDSSGWSEVRRLRYNPNIVARLDMNSQLTETINSYQERSSGMQRNEDSVVMIYKSRKDQFSDKELNGVHFNNELNGFELSDYTGNIFVRAHGENYWDATYFTSNNLEFYLLGQQYQGYNIVKLRKIDGKILDLKNFKITNAQLSSDSVINFLNTFNDNHILLIIKGYPFSNVFLNANAKTKIRGFGSEYVDTLVNRLDKWAFISVPMGNGKYDTREGYFRWDNVNWIPVEVDLSLSQSTLEGKITGVYGPAENWGHLSWEQSLQNNQRINFNVYGITHQGNDTLLMQEVGTNSGVDLTSINAYHYPNLKLVCNIFADTSSTVSSPVFKGMRLVYQPAAEFCINSYNWASGDSVFQYQNYSTRVKLEFANLGYSDYYGAVVNWFTKFRGSTYHVQSDTLNYILYKDSSYVLNSKFKVYNYVQGQIVPTKLPLTLDITPLSGQNEFYMYNNKLYKTVYLKSELPGSPLSVAIGGNELSGGERVNANPEVKALLKNVSGSAISDTSLMSVYVNGRYIPYYGITSYNEKINTFERSEQEKTFTLRLQPFLDPGENKLSFVFRLGAGMDPDTVSYNVFVDNEFRVENLYNYPNPMRGETRFMFDMNGAHEVSSVSIRIYTVSGRQIKKIDVWNPVNGLNEIEWDGRDEDGDFIANGTYLYRMSISGDKNLELPVQKLVVLR